MCRAVALHDKKEEEDYELHRKPLHPVYRIPVQHHCESENYCSLEKIQIGTHETDPTVKQCTDCMSFDRK